MSEALPWNAKKKEVLLLLWAHHIVVAIDIYDKSSSRWELAPVEYWYLPSTVCAGGRHRRNDE